MPHGHSLEPGPTENISAGGGDAVVLSEPGALLSKLHICRPEEHDAERRRTSYGSTCIFARHFSPRYCSPERVGASRTDPSQAMGPDSVHHPRLSERTALHAIICIAFIVAALDYTLAGQFEGGVRRFFRLGIGLLLASHAVQIMNFLFG